MTIPPIYNLQELGPQAQMMSKNLQQRTHGNDSAIRRHRFHDHHGRSRRRPGPKGRIRPAQL